MKKFLIIFLISMVPLIELRGAIPVAVGMGLPIIPAILVSVVGNMIPVPLIFLFARRFLEWGKDKRLIGGICRWCLDKGEKGGRQLEAKAGKGLYWALLLFVGIPVPGTGAWTGTLAASILNMDFRKSVLYVLLGILLAGAIMIVLSLGIFGAISLVK
ncbi:MAG: small multi-drug export protein [Bacteroidales bacterium]|nr:small multi-drug export protein [Bacteroidales bacterium]